jgi:YidC/Oxa1 family membrane protein insertase
MDRNTVLRWVVIAAAVVLFWKFGKPALFGESGSKAQPIPAETYVDAPTFGPDSLDPQPTRPEGAPAYAEPVSCTIKGKRFEADLSSRGAALVHLRLADGQYGEAGKPMDMSTTPDHERWRSLRTLFRGEGADDQVKYDRFPWKVEAAPDGSACTFTYQDETVQITKRISARPADFELEVETSVKNLAAEAKKHRLTIGMYAFRKNSEIKGKLGRVSPFVTELGCAHGKEVVHKAKDDFKEGWFDGGAVDRYAAVSNYFFAQALVPEDGTPKCSLLAEDWFAAGQARDDDDAAAVYHARLAYDPRVLQPGESTSYKQIAFMGPKERDVLKAAGGGRGLSDLINLGFFSPVAKVLVAFLLFIKTHVTGSWGLAIIVMTICLRTLLFPLSWRQIKTTIGMRRLKPELDLLNKKFPDDLQAKNLAMMELYKKHGINPLGGCLPQMVQMPVWFAMYTTLQTAVEMYHSKFLWFSDLSAPDKFYVLPIVLGGLMILQQRIVPQQGMDPAQQKMMMYLLPGIFTVMMLFLPAALGVYMMTNSLLGIVQQLVVERIAPRDKPGKGEIVVKTVESGKETPAALGKGKARV